MIELANIIENTEFRTFQKAIHIYQQGKIIKAEVKYYADILEISALVMGSNRQAYTVEVAYSNIEEDFVDSYCDCKAFDTYPGLCKHCAGVLIDYIYDKEKRRNGYEWEATYGEDESYGYDNRQGYRRRTTNAQVKSLFNKGAMIRSEPLIDGVTSGTIRIEPTITLDARSAIVEFKLGNNRMYVMRNIEEFAEAVTSQTFYRYGKQLGFVHEKSAFEDTSKEVVDFIDKAIKRRKNSYYGLERKKELPLDSDDIVNILQIYIDKEIAASIDYGKIKPHKVKLNQLKRKLSIKKVENGIELEVKNFYGLEASNHYVFFDKNTIYIEEIEKIRPIQEFLLAANDIMGEIFIAEEDVPAFCRNLLPVLEEFYEIKKEGFDKEKYTIEEPSFSYYLDAPKKELITCIVKVTYGEKEYLLFSQENAAQRDGSLETKYNKIVSAFFSSYDEKKKMLLIEDDEDMIFDLIDTGIPMLQKTGEVFITDRLKNINIVRKAKVAVGVSIESELLELQLASEDMELKELASILKNYNPKKKYYRMKNGDFIRVEGEELEMLHDLHNTLQVGEAMWEKGQVQIPKFRALYVDEMLKASEGVHTTKDRNFKELIRNASTFEESDFEVPTTLEANLREYQKKGYLWLKTLRNNGFGGILADDMGLGKTLQVITFLLSEYEEQDKRKALIVCPSSLVYNWESEFHKFAPTLQVKTVVGQKGQREEIVESGTDCEIFITSYDLLKRDEELYSEHFFDYIVLDEAQFIKNHNTLASKAVKGLQGDFRLALTGTPIENRLSELWSIFGFIMPGFLYSYKKFKDNIELPIVQAEDQVAIKRLQRMTSPFILRRLKQEVLTDLPDKIEEHVLVRMTGEQRKVYDAHAANLKLQLQGQSDSEFTTSKIQILAELTKLRQVCCEPKMLYDNFEGESAKMDACVELVKEAVSGNHKILIFSQFTSVFEHLQKKLRKEKITYHTLTGKTSKEKRREMVASFQTDDVHVFCISLKAGGTGLNLPVADIVIHYDPWWNAAVQDQATDRAHRIGQKNTVNVYKLVAQHSIEEKIVKLQDAKKDLATKVLEGKGMSVSQFSKEELLDILS